MFAAQIEKGVEYLNQNYPGWFNKIDLDELCLGDDDRCVIGQLGGPHELAFDVEYGFNLHFGTFTLARHDAWNTLTEEWKDKIRQLRELSA